jgi:large subunit ribosomal protein L15
MINHEITSIVGRHTKRCRVGRGPGSGHGKTCKRGTKGSLSRAGAKVFSLYEGGAVPLYRRLPKRGFSNFKFTPRFEIVNICQLEQFEDGSSIGPEQLKHAGLINNAKSNVKILGNGDLTKKLQITAHKFSKSAQQKISAIGGTMASLAVQHN